MSTFSSPTPAPGGRRLATSAFKNAGLVDCDERMRDATSDNPNPGGRKGISKIRAHRPRPMDVFKGHQPGPTRASTTQPGSSVEGLSIRGAAGARGSTVGRLRRIAPGPASTATRRGRGETTGPSEIDIWRGFVNSRWDPQTRFLNLESMSNDPEVIKYRLRPPWASESFIREASVIFKLASQLKPTPETISLANNNINSGQLLSTLSRHLPLLANLSLQNNNLKVWRDIDQISGRRGKLEHLRELILLGNPLRELEMKHNRGDKYKSEVTRRFPSLTMLDQEAIATIAFDVPGPSSPVMAERPTATTFPFEMKPSFITGVDNSVIRNFLVRFFPLFDDQRVALLDAYHPSATFSFSVNTSIPVRARIQGLHSSKEFPNQRKLEWPVWLDAGSRNLARLGRNDGVDKAVNTLHVGSEAAIRAMTALPKTKHEISGSPEKFCIDAWPIGQGENTKLLVSLHGQFNEVPSQGIRSFDRTFILAPAAEGSRAKLNGWDVVILSDQWAIRPYSSHEAWRHGPMRVQAGEALQQPSGSTLVPPQAEEALTGFSEPQRSLILQIRQKTGLNVKYAVDCLQNNGWNLDRAVADFERVKAVLSQDAFL